MDIACVTTVFDEGTTGLDLPANYNLAGNYYDITTTADFSGRVEVCLNYMVFQYYLEIITFDECQQDLADVNQDDSITPSDALCIFQEYMGLPSCLEE